MQESGEEEGNFLTQFLENPEQLLEDNKEIAQTFLEMTCAFFEATKSSELYKGAAGVLDKLHTNCSVYSMWGQIKLQNDSVLKSAQKAIEKEREREEKRRRMEEEEDGEKEQFYEPGNIQENGEEEEESSDDDLIKRMKEEQEREKRGEDVRGTDEENEYDNEEEEIDYDDFEFDSKNGIQNAHISDENLEEEDSEEEENGEGKLAPVKEDEDEAISKLLVGGDTGEDDNAAKHMTYEDFFGNDQDDDDNQGENKGDEYDDEYYDDDEYDDEKHKIKKEAKNTNDDLNLDEKALKGRISEIEKIMMEPKPWQMSGETTAMERPKDALLELDVDFNVSKRLPPDPLTSEQLEALLLKRIENMQFDDVVRKKKPVDVVSKFEEVSQMKSKKTLVELYEDEIRNRNSEYQDDVQSFTQEQKKAIEMWKSLEHELNKFTERRFVARRPQEKVEVTQMANVDAEVRAEPTQTPEEIMKPTTSTKDMKGESEWTHKERRSKRRSHKEWYGKRQEKKDAEKGVLYNQTGRDGGEVKLMQDVKKLAEGKLQGIETYQPGQTIPSEKQERKDVRKNYLL